MSHSLLQAMKMIHNRIDHNNLDIHTMAKAVKNILDIANKNSKLRIINQFILVVYVLVLNTKYENVRQTEKVKSIVKDAFALIEKMSLGTVIYTHAAQSIAAIIAEIRSILVEKLKAESFLYDQTLIEYFSEYLDRDLKDLELVYQNISLDKEDAQYKSIMQIFLRVDSLFSFLGIKPLSFLVETMQNFVLQQHKSGFVFQLNSNLSFVAAVDYLFRQAAFLKLHKNEKESLEEYFSKINVDRHTDALKSHAFTANQDPSGLELPNVFLTEEEVDALMNDDDFDTVSFDQKDETDIAHTLLEYSAEEMTYRITKYGLDEDRIIKLLGRLFQKQEEITDHLTAEERISLKDDIQEISILTESIKDLVFRKYCATLEEIFGQELRTFIQEESQSLGKNVYLDIRGEHSEILLRESAFVKEIVFTLVKNALHFSLESSARRKALEKSEIGWLSIEFDDSGDKLDIFVRDDGLGLDMTHMDLSEIESKIKLHGGIIQFDSVDREYLKVKVQIPMRKVLSNCLVLTLGDTKVLLPNRCVQKILSVNEVAVLSGDSNYLGKINLSVLLGLDKSPVNVFVLCQFGNHKICFGVQTVLYKIDALVETINTKLIACATGVSILKDGFLGFVLNERLLYEMSVEMIKKRTQMMSVEKV